MNKLFSILIISLFLISFASAAPPFIDNTIRSNSGLLISSNIPFAIPQNQTREFEIHLVNSTNIIESNAACFIHIYDESKTGGHLYKNSSTTFVDQDIEFIIPSTVHLTKGEYSFKVYCNTTGKEAALYEASYYVTKNGLIPAGDSFILFIWLLFILATIGIFFTFFIGIFKLVMAETGIYDVLLSWGFYLLLIVDVYLAENYLLSTFIETLGNSFLNILVWTNGVLPLIAFIISFFIQSTKKKRLLSPQEVNGSWT